MTDSYPQHPEMGGQPVRPQHVSARVPERVSRGVFSTGAIIITGGSEFILDFVQNIGRPHQIVARVVMPHNVLPQFIDALQKNVELYKKQFGPPPAVPPASGSQQRRLSAQEVYDDLKLPDDLLSGTYANGVMIGHTGSEFSFDFLTNFFPQSAVSARVFLSAAQIPRLLQSMIGTHQQFQQRAKKQQPPDQNPPDAPPPESPPPEPPPPNDS